MHRLEQIPDDDLFDLIDGRLSALADAFRELRAAKMDYRIRREEARRRYDAAVELYGEREQKYGEAVAALRVRGLKKPWEEGSRRPEATG